MTKTLCDENSHTWDISEPLIWLWPDLPYPRHDLLCDCRKCEFGLERARKYAIQGSLYYVSEDE